VPSLSEILPGFEAISWLGVGCAPGVAPDIAARLGEAMRKVGADPVYIEKIRGIGAEPEVSATPDAFVAFLESEQARWKKVAVDAAIPMIDWPGGPRAPWARNRRRGGGSVPTAGAGDRPATWRSAWRNPRRFQYCAASAA